MAEKALNDDELPPLEFDEMLMQKFVDTVVHALGVARSALVLAQMWLLAAPQALARACANLCSNTPPPQ